MLRLRHRGARMTLALEGVTPDRLAALDAIAVAKLPLAVGNAQAPLGDFFEVNGCAADGEILLEGAGGPVESVGAGMVSGRLTVQGDVGAHAGAGMIGGVLHVHGVASDWLGAEMRGGRIHVRGDAGHRVGSPYPGGRVGMRGGAILVEGSAGDDIGSNLRRGLIAVGGSCGAFAGCGMIAGSLFVFGNMGPRPGAGMKRGTLVCADQPPPLLPTFRFDCVYHPVFLTLYFQQLRAWGFAATARSERGSWRRYSGDLLALGKGEFLCPGD